jgi:hypothetical protein
MALALTASLSRPYVLDRQNLARSIRRPPGFPGLATGVRAIRNLILQ